MLATKLRHRLFQSESGGREAELGDVLTYSDCTASVASKLCIHKYIVFDDFKVTIFLYAYAYMYIYMHVLYRMHVVMYVCICVITSHAYGNIHLTTYPNHIF